MFEYHGKGKNPLSLEIKSKSLCSFVPVQNGCQSTGRAGNYRWEQGGLQRPGHNSCRGCTVHEEEFHLISNPGWKNPQGWGLRAN